MPFDQENFALPAVETDEVIRELTLARAVIRHPENWTRYALARDRHGVGCWPVGDAASHSFCALGAIIRVGIEAGGNLYLGAALSSRWDQSVADFNNHPDTTHADVLALFDRAIAARRKDLTERAAQRVESVS